MEITPEILEHLVREEFPRSRGYDPEWILTNEMGPNALWLTEALCSRMSLKPGMIVLDMGCGKGMSSVFLAREYDVTVFANDLWIDPADNLARFREASVADRVFPIHAEARALPYAHGFFDAIISIDSYHYYGTDDLYLHYLMNFLKPAGQFGMTGPGLTRELEGDPPEHLVRRRAGGGQFWEPVECLPYHSAKWWERHFEVTGLVTVELADDLPDGWRHWLEFEKARLLAGVASNADDLLAIEEDAGTFLAIHRIVSRRKQS